MELFVFIEITPSLWCIRFIQIIPYRDDNGNMGISQEGWDKLQDYFDNGYSTPEGEDWVDNFTSGKIPIGYTWMSNVPVIEEEYGINIGVINPDDGVVQTVEQIGILADGDDNTLEQNLLNGLVQKKLWQNLQSYTTKCQQMKKHVRVLLNE